MSLSSETPVTHVACKFNLYRYTLDQRAADDRALTAKSVAHLTAQFSKDMWSRDHMDANELALLVWSFAEMPGEGWTAVESSTCDPQQLESAWFGGDSTL